MKNTRHLSPCRQSRRLTPFLVTHIVQSVQMVTKPSPAGDYELYITRFLDENGETMLSAMLHGKEGSYEPGAADYWEKLRTTFGAEQSVA